MFYLRSDQNNNKNTVHFKAKSLGEYIKKSVLKHRTGFAEEFEEGMTEFGL